MTIEEQSPFIDSSAEKLRVFCLNNHLRKEIIKKGRQAALPEKGMLGFINKGRLKVFMGTENGNERLMWYLEAGNVIPQGSGVTYMKRLIADTDTEILYLKGSELFRFAMADEENLLEILAQNDTRRMLCVQVILKEHDESSRAKVYKFIYQMAVHYGKANKDGLLIDPLPNRSDIAAFTGVHRSNVTRYIGELEQQGIITKVKKAILVNDLDGLDALIQEENDKFIGDK